MGWLSGEYKYKEIPGLGGYLGPLSNFNPKADYGSKSAKKFLKAADRGEDVSSYGRFNTVRQQAAAERQGIGENYMTGGNALLANAGGDQAALLNRLRDAELEKSYQREGMNLTQALTDERANAADLLQRGSLARQGMRLNAMQSALQGKIGGNQLVKEGGWLGNLLSSFASGAGGALMGGLTGGASLPMSSFSPSKMLGSSPTMWPGR